MAAARRATGSRMVIVILHKKIFNVIKQFLRYALVSITLSGPVF